MNDQSDGIGYYLYSGTNTGLTNIYLEWQGSSNNYQGSVVYYDYNPDFEVIEAYAEFDQTLAQPTLEVWILYDGTGTGSSGYSDATNFHILLTKISENEVTVSAKAMYNRDYPNPWDLVGYGHASQPGGALAWSGGTTNISWGGQDALAGDYRYEEYFSSDSTVLYKIGTYDVWVSNQQVATNYIYDPVTYTNNGIQSEVYGILTNISPRTDSYYPDIVLP